MAGKGSSPGERRGGRKKGTPNKLTQSVKQVFEEAFEDMGGAKALVSWGKLNQTDFYKLYARLIPQDINAKHGLSDSLAELLAGVK